MSGYDGANPSMGRVLEPWQLSVAEASRETGCFVTDRVFPKRRFYAEACDLSWPELIALWEASR